MTNRYIAGISLDLLEDGYSATVTINGETLRFAPTRTVGTALLLAANAIIDAQREAAKRPLLAGASPCGSVP